MRLYLYFIGKPRDEHANAIAEEFIKRSSRYAACEMREIRPDRFDLFAFGAKVRVTYNSLACLEFRFVYSPHLVSTQFSQSHRGQQNHSGGRKGL